MAVGAGQTRAGGAVLSVVLETGLVTVAAVDGLLAAVSEAVGLVVGVVGACGACHTRGLVTSGSVRTSQAGCAFVLAVLVLADGTCSPESSGITTDVRSRLMFRSSQA